MLLVIFGVSVVAIILAIIMDVEWCVDEDIVVPTLACGIVVAFASFIAIIILLVDTSSLSVVDEKINMYMEENTKIETSISETIEQYEQYEQETFEKVKPESAITLVTVYPELKSDTLVQEQIKVYLKNNERIKSLKEDKIRRKVLHWWLYFGN